MSYVRSLVAIAVVACPLVLQAVEVVEGQPDVVAKPSSSFGVQRVEQTAPPISAELLVKVQQLEAEVRELRGLLEQQSHLLEQLTQRRLADYVELDRRIQVLQGDSGEPARPATDSASLPSTPRQANAVQSPTPVKAPPVATARTDQAKAAYQSAYQLVKARKFDDARSALTGFVASYPDSYYIPNALYWLGELHYLDGNLGKARDAFYELVTEHSNYRKVPEAKFKLGKIYHQLGDADRAIVMLRSVLSDHSTSKAADPARNYLNERLQ